MRNQTPPAPPGWNKTIEDLSDEAKKTGSPVGSPEVDWAREYELSLIPAGTRFPKKGDVYEATDDLQVSYLTSWSAPFTGGGVGTLKKGERVIVDHDMFLPRPVAVYAKPIDYATAEERMVPKSDRATTKYAGFYLCLKTVDLDRNFRLVHEESTPAEYQEESVKNSFIIGLSSWFIQDGNYRDFKLGDQVAFAVEFYSPNGLSVLEGRDHVASLEHLHSSTYRIVGRVVHVRDCEWWAIDAGILMYRAERPPPGVEEGCWVGGEAYIGVDPFLYFERLSRHHTAPGLIYDWIIKRIEIQTAPFIKGNEGYMIRDPKQLGWREIDATSAGQDGIGAEYILHCERLDSPPRR